MKIGASILLLVLIALAAVVGASAYTVDEGHQAVITRFGKPVGEVTDA